MKAIPDVYYHMDEPTADGCAIAVYSLAYSISLYLAKSKPIV